MYVEIKEGRVKKGTSFIENIFSAIAIICISVLVVLNTTMVYSYVVDKYNLSKYTGLSSEALIENYKSIIYYLQNPFNKELILSDFPMSDFGRIHFFEVKQIFMFIYLISIIYILRILFIIIKSKDYRRRLLDILNKSSNIIMMILVTISIMVYLDFSKAFYAFHKIFFRNDYWIFDPATDPVINALPEELFIIKLIMIILVLVTFIIGIKIMKVKIRNR